MNCELCKLDVITKLYKETDEYTILDCMVCNVPMIVWKGHTMKLTSSMKTIMIKAILEVAEEVFGLPNYYIDGKQRKIPDHLHWHVRKK